MKYHGVEIDLIGVSAVISAITAFVLAITGRARREKRHARKDEDDP